MFANSGAVCSVDSAVGRGRPVGRGGVIPSESGLARSIFLGSLEGCMRAMSPNQRS